MLTRHHHTAIAKAIAITALSTLLLIGCSTATSQSAHGPKPSTSQAAETSAPTAEVPPYYSEFDPELVAETVQPPCANIPDDFFLELGLDLKTRRDTVHPTETVMLCSFRGSVDSSKWYLPSRQYIFTWNHLDEKEVYARFEVFRKEGPWIIADEETTLDNTECTASISTKRGRFTVTRAQFNPDPSKQEYFCIEALDIAKRTADYLHYEVKMI